MKPLRRLKANGNLDRSLTGARIETLDRIKNFDSREIAPSQERGLKPSLSQTYRPSSGIAPSQERGLKPLSLMHVASASYRSLTGARIETDSQQPVSQLPMDRSLTGARIETSNKSG